MFLAVKAFQCDTELVHAGIVPRLGESAPGEEKDEILLDDVK